jgi:hypothetical protein
MASQDWFPKVHTCPHCRQKSNASVCPKPECLQAATARPNGFYVFVLENGKKRGKFLRSDGYLTTKRIHACRYPTEESAKAECENIRTNYPEHFTNAWPVPVK